MIPLRDKDIVTIQSIETKGSLPTLKEPQKYEITQLLLIDANVRPFLSLQKRKEKDTAYVRCLPLNVNFYGMPIVLSSVLVGLPCTVSSSEIHLFQVYSD